MNILVTGAAGFIGAAFIKKFLENNSDVDSVTGIDNLNNYYNPCLKLKRLEQIGINIPIIPDTQTPNLKKEDLSNKFLSSKYPNFKFQVIDLNDDGGIENLFRQENFDIVVHLAAQAGVRPSKINNKDYIKSNIDGFFNIIENCKCFNIKHLIYASSSSVYGLNSKTPFSEHHGIAHPVSLYAATKKSNELIAHVYSSLYGLPTTGLRFFTVYGPWGRPDMSPLLFMDAIMHNRQIKLFNNGNMVRDFTFIDDITEGIFKLISKIPQVCENWDTDNPDPASSRAPYKIFNIGNSSPIKLIDYIECLEEVTGKKAKLCMQPMQPGDVVITHSDTTELAKIINFYPQTSLKEGLIKTFEWYKKYYNLL